MKSYHDPTEIVLEALRRHGKTIRQTGQTKYLAQCPAHDDGNPSLSIDQGDDGRALLHCFAECSVDDICASLQIQTGQLFPGNESVSKSGSEVSESLRKAPPIDTSRYVSKSGPQTAYIYFDADGQYRYERIRKPLANGKKTFYFERSGEKGLGSAKQLPYMLPLIVGDQTGTIHIPEGQKDALELTGIGFVATDIADAAMTDDALRLFRGKHVVIYQDNDEPGRKKANARAEWLHSTAASIRVVTFDEMPVGGDVSDYLDDNSSDDLIARINSTPEWAPSENLKEEPTPAPIQWEDPVPLDRVESGPQFPTDRLPGILGRFVRGVAEETQTPPDVPAVMGLSTISAATNGRYVVSLPEYNWNEHVHTQMFSCLPPGNRKSAVERETTQPISEHEREVNPGELIAIADHESRQRVLEKSLSSAENSAGRASDHNGKIRDPEAIRRAALEELSAHKEFKPTLTRIRVDDATPEALLSAAYENGGAIAALSAESAIFMFNRYGGDSPILDPLLKGHAGDDIRILRKGRPAETMEHFCFTVGVMMQPGGVRDLGKVNGFVERGVAARLLPSFPADVLGRRRIDTTPVSLDLRDEYAATIRRILKRVPPTRNGCYVPWQLTLDRSAHEVFREFRQWHESEMGPFGQFADMRGWGAKLPGAILRIAGLMHAFSHSEPELVQIDTVTIQNAIDIGHYFTAHAAIMHRMITQQESDESAQALLAAMLDLGHRFTKRDLHRRVRNQVAFSKTSDLDEPLGTLEELGYIRLSKEQVSGSGRPSVVIDLNPRASGSREKPDPQPLISPPGDNRNNIRLLDRSDDYRVIAEV